MPVRCEDRLRAVPYQPEEEPVAACLALGVILRCCGSSPLSRLPVMMRGDTIGVTTSEMTGWMDLSTTSHSLPSLSCYFSVTSSISQCLLACIRSKQSHTSSSIIISCLCKPSLFNGLGMQGLIMYNMSTRTVRLYNLRGGGEGL